MLQDRRPKKAERNQYLSAENKQKLRETNILGQKTKKTLAKPICWARKPKKIKGNQYFGPENQERLRETNILGQKTKKD